MTDSTMKALVIDVPWINLILDGSKTWEMRSIQTKLRGQFGLIRKGSGMVWGVASLSDCGEAMEANELIRHFDKHRIPEQMIRTGEVAKWNRPWKLTSVRKLAKPVPYKHKPGAVTWVNLEPDVAANIRTQLAA
jgi:hypothetical protein